MVKAAVDVAVTVIDPPKETGVPLIVTAELVREAFGMLLNVLVAPLIDFPVSVPGMSSLTSKRKAVVALGPDIGPAYT
jgi:hypothetical protein